MYTYTYNVSGFEQGTISSSGNSDSATVIRTSGYIQCPTNPGKVKIVAVSTSGKAFKIDFLGYKDSSTISPLCDLYWYDSPHEFDISSYRDISYFRLCLKYSDDSDITPSEISECNLIVEFAWKMGANGKPTNEYLPDSSDLPDAPLTQPYPKTMWHIVDGKPTHDFMSKLPESSLTQPYPKTMWRINPLVNDGKPYHDYLPDSVDLGAFANATNLTYVRIPPTVKKIGRYSFRNTKLTSVTIASDCEYYETSFPDGCQIKFY